MKIEPYLNFDGRCDEAIEFYKNALGARVIRLMRFKDMPGGGPPSGQIPPEIMEKVMHANLLIGDTHVLVSDGRCTNKGAFSGVSLALNVASDAEAARFFAALGDGGKVTMPLGKTFFSSSFGMVTDRFGVAWMVVVEH
jgi:PhnB protein